MSFEIKGIFKGYNYNCQSGFPSGNLYFIAATKERPFIVDKKFKSRKEAQSAIDKHFSGTEILSIEIIKCLKS